MADEIQITPVSAPSPTANEVAAVLKMYRSSRIMTASLHAPVGLYPKPQQVLHGYSMTGAQPGNQAPHPGSSKVLH
jgi:hypothetical protein